MIRINLLPFRAARKKENVRRQVSVFILTMFLVLAALSWFHISLGARVEDAQRRVEETRGELKKLEAQLKEIERIRKVLDTIQRKTAVIEDLELNREAAVRLMAAMTQVVIRDRLYLTRLRMSGTQVELDGIAADNQTIADFMTRLEESGLFNKVDLNATAAEKTKSGLTLQKFSIIGAKKPLVRPAAAASTAKKAG
jgi:type IV pilus assembly protein PilN